MCVIPAETFSSEASACAMKALAAEGRSSASSTQQMSASSAAVVMAPDPAAPSAACGRRCGDYDDDDSEVASTAASSESGVLDDPDSLQEPAKRIRADFVESEDEPDACVVQGEVGLASSPAVAAQKAARSKQVARWADLADSDEENSSPKKGPKQASKLEDKEEVGPSATSKAAAAAAPALAASPPSKGQNKWTQKGEVQQEQQWMEVAVASPSEELPAQAGNKAGKTKASQKNEDWWVQQHHELQWGSKAAAWWDSKSCNEWWDESESSWWAHQQSWDSRGAETSGRSQQVDRRGSVASGISKPQCQFFIGIDEEPKFKVTRRILGPHGQHMKSIAEASGAKLRLRGLGSGFLEGEEMRESADELMLCVSAPDWECYQEAVHRVTELLNVVYTQYRTFGRRSAGSAPSLEIRMHEGPRPGGR